MPPIPEEVNDNDPHHKPAPAINTDDNITAAAATATRSATLDRSTQTLQQSCTQGTMTDESGVAAVKDSPEMTPRSTAGASHSIAWPSGPAPPDGEQYLCNFTACCIVVAFAYSA